MCGWDIDGIDGRHMAQSTALNGQWQRRRRVALKCGLYPPRAVFMVTDALCAYSLLNARQGDS